MQHIASTQRTSLALVGVCALVVGLPAVARAQSTPTGTGVDDPRRREAAEHFRVGREHFERGEFEGALREITRSYELVPIPALLYNIAVSHRRLGDLDAAIQTFERYLATGGDAIAAERRAEVEQVLAELRGSTVEVHLDVQAPAGVTPTITVDRRVVPGPWSRTYRFSPGPHDAHAEAPGMQAVNERFTLSPGPSVTVRLALSPPPVTTGTIVVAVAVNANNLRVFVDGHRTDEWSRGMALEQGPHSIRVEADGYQVFRETVRVVARETRNVAATMVLLPPPPPPFYRHPGFWAGVVGGGVALAVGGIVWSAFTLNVRNRGTNDTECQVGMFAVVCR